jgi:DNA-binding NarL/FixJ family response regulator
MLADDNPAILDTVRQMLEKDFEIAGMVQSAAELFQELPKLKPDVLILDISMEDMNGFEVTRRLVAEGSAPKIIFLTVHEEFEFVRAAFDAGASGYVFKSRMNIDMHPAIAAVQSGKAFLPQASLLE